MSFPQLDESDRVQISHLSQATATLVERKDDLEAKLRQLEQEIGRNQAQLAALHNKASFACNLPTEILCHILKAAHSAVYRSRAQPLSMIIPPEVACSLVCTGWRTAILSMPQLWSTFHCINPSLTILESENERLQVYLDRSKDHDLEFVFRFKQLGGTHQHTLLQRLLNATLPHVARWKKLSLASDGEDGVAIGFHQPLRTLHAPRLEYLDVRTRKYHDFHNLGWDSEPDWNPKLFHRQNPPSLRYLRLDISAALARYRPRFGNFVHVSLEAGPVLSMLGRGSATLTFLCFIEILRQPTIETISLWGDMFASIDLDLMEDLEAPRLKHFRIGNCWQISPLEFLLGRVKAPRLETITIQNVWFPFSGGLPQLRIGDTNDYIFPAFRELHLTDGMMRLRSGELLQETERHPLHYLARRTRNARRLTLAMRSIRDHKNILMALHMKNGVVWKGPGDDRMANDAPFDLALCPDAEEVTLVALPSMTDNTYLNSLGSFWPRVKKVIVPESYYVPPEWTSSGVQLERIGRTSPLGINSWPPGYSEATWRNDVDARDDDPFFLQEKEAASL